MSRTLLLILLGLLAAFAFPSGTPPEPAAVPNGAKANEADEAAIALTVDAASEPRPALRYTLLPSLAEMTPGNPIQGYMMCMAGDSLDFKNKAVCAEREKWQKMPLAELPVDDVLRSGRGPLRLADEAARRTTPDWQLLTDLKAKGGMGLRGSDMHQLRPLSEAVRLRFRAEMAAGRFTAAIESAKTMLALSRHLAEYPSALGNLFASAVALRACETIEEMIAQPGCPNLYWALAQLPSPFIDLHKAVEGERLTITNEFAPFAPDALPSAARLDQVLARLDTLMEAAWLMDIPDSKKPGVVLRRRAKDPRQVHAARKRLAVTGLARDKLEKMPVLQVLLLDEQHAYECLLHERLKWAHAPWPAAEGELRKEQKSDALFARLVFNLYHVFSARVRVEQRLAMLRHVEAIRLYAAGHGGKLPARLADIEVPLPDDPFTGKPFAYKVAGKKATLRGAPPVPGDRTAAYNVVYQIAIR